MTDLEFHKDQAVLMIKSQMLRKDKKGRYYYCVNSDRRRNCQMIVSAATIKKLVRDGLINQLDVDKNNDVWK